MGGLGKHIRAVHRYFSEEEDPDEVEVAASSSENFDSLKNHHGTLDQMHDSIACEERERDLLTQICELGVAVKEGLEVKAELMKCRKVIEELRSKKDTKNDEFIAVLNTLKVPGFKEPVMGALMAHNESLAAQLESSTKEIYELKESLISFRKGILTPELLQSLVKVENPEAQDIETFQVTADMVIECGEENPDTVEDSPEANADQSSFSSSKESSPSKSDLGLDSEEVSREASLNEPSDSEDALVPENGDHGSQEESPDESGLEPGDCDSYCSEDENLECLPPSSTDELSAVGELFNNTFDDNSTHGLFISGGLRNERRLAVDSVGESEVEVTTDDVEEKGILTMRSVQLNTLRSATALSYDDYEWQKGGDEQLALPKDGIKVSDAEIGTWGKRRNLLSDAAQSFGANCFKLKTVSDLEVLAVERVPVVQAKPISESQIGSEINLESRVDQESGTTGGLNCNTNDFQTFDKPTLGVRVMVTKLSSADISTWTSEKNLISSAAQNSGTKNELPVKARVPVVLLKPISEYPVGSRDNFESRVDQEPETAGDSICITNDSLLPDKPTLDARLVVGDKPSAVDPTAREQLIQRIDNLGFEVSPTQPFTPAFGDCCLEVIVDQLDTYHGITTSPPDLRKDTVLFLKKEVKDGKVDAEAFEYESSPEEYYREMETNGVYVTEPFIRSCAKLLKRDFIIIHSRPRDLATGHCGVYKDFTWIHGGTNGEKSTIYCPIFFGYLQDSDYAQPHYQSILPYRKGEILDMILKEGGYDVAASFLLNDLIDDADSEVLDDPTASQNFAFDTQSLAEPMKDVTNVDTGDSEELKEGTELVSSTDGFDSSSADSKSQVQLENVTVEHAIAAAGFKDDFKLVDSEDESFVNEMVEQMDIDNVSSTLLDGKVEVQTPQYPAVLENCDFEVETLSENDTETSDGAVLRTDASTLDVDTDIGNASVLGKKVEGLEETGEKGRQKDLSDDLEFTDESSGDEDMDGDSGLTDELTRLPDGSVVVKHGDAWWDWFEQKPSNKSIDLKATLQEYPNSSSDEEDGGGSEMEFDCEINSAGTSCATQGLCKICIRVAEMPPCQTHRYCCRICNRLKCKKVYTTSSKLKAHLHNFHKLLL